MHRFFADRSQFSENTVRLEGDDVKHISRVLRLRCGDKISVCNKESQDFVCTLSEIGKDYALAQIEESMANGNESELCVTLYQGLPKGDKMDYIIQKSVELGAVRIVPVVMKRTVVKPKSADGKTDRWNRISEEAAKQCIRGIIPKVESPISFEEMLGELEKGGLSILPYENERQTKLKDILTQNKTAKNINIIIGPEGGFEEEEVATCLSKGVHAVTLGPRIMRCETAPLAAISAVMYELGDW